MLVPVAPRVGAWIETYGSGAAKFYAVPSHPEWVRGLKPNAWIQSKRTQMTSHPEWVRGLKHSIIEYGKVAANVAPRVGAWIETPNLSILRQCVIVAPRVGAWIETP